MATDVYSSIQATTEIRTHFVDFTPDLPDAVSISSATATLSGYPAGGTATVSVGVIADGIVPVVVSLPTIAGAYTVSVLATLSNGDKSAAQLIVPVQWAAVRATMIDLIQNLREMTDTSANDYKVSGVPYWSDKHLQDALDSHQTIYDFEVMQDFPQRAGTVYDYKLFDTHIKHWELSPVITDNQGGTIASGYGFDARLGRVSFTASQAGSARCISGTAYDLNAAAADVWQKKVAHYAGAYDFSTDNHSLKRSQLVQQAREMARYYAGLTLPGSFTVERGDTSNGC